MSYEKQLVETTFYITYAFLITTGTITFIEAMRTKDSKIRNILNLETCISVVAAFFYGKFVSLFEKKTDAVSYKTINDMRYLDWSITTPFMLLVLCAVLGKNVGKTVGLSTFGAIVALNYFMLLTGYLGEIDLMNKSLAALFGFGGLYGIFYLIYKTFLENKNVLANNILFGIYLVIWSLYGVVYFLDEEYKNIFTNILDAIAKSGMGIGLWAYYTKIVTL